MPEFKATKLKGATQIEMLVKEKKATLWLALLLFLQSIAVYVFLDNKIIEVTLLSLSLLFVITSFIKKILVLNQSTLIIKNTLFSVPIFKKVIHWNKIDKAMVEINKVRLFDVFFEYKGKTRVIQRSMKEENADKLLQEIQTYHHYLVNKK